MSGASFDLRHYHPRFHRVRGAPLSVLLQPVRNPWKPRDSAGASPHQGRKRDRGRTMSFVSASDTGDVTRQAGSRTDGLVPFGCGRLGAHSSRRPQPTFFVKESQ